MMCLAHALPDVRFKNVTVSSHLWRVDINQLDLFSAVSAVRRVFGASRRNRNYP